MSIDQVFPRRGLRVVRPGLLRGYWLAVIGLAFGLGMAAFLGFGIAPELRRDLTVRADLATTPDARISGTCRTRKFVFIECQGNASYRVAGRAYTTSFDFFFVGFGSQSTTARVVYQRANPAVATIDAALDNMTSRLALAGLIGIVALTGFYGFVSGLRRARAITRGLASMQDQVLEPVEVLLTTDQKSMFARMIGYSARIDGREAKFQTRLPKNAEPYWLPNPQGLPLALGVTGGDRSVVVLLDANLSQLDLVDQERSAIAAARAATYGVPQAA